MAETALVKETLSGEQIAAGAELVKKLDEKEIPLAAAFWFFLPEPNQWRLILASPLVRLEGPKRLYRQVQSLLTKVGDSAVRLADVAVIDSQDPLILLLGNAIRTGTGISGIRFSRNTINGVFIDDAYIYRLSGAG